MNIVLFGIDDTAIKNLAVSISKKLNMKYIDANDEFLRILLEKDAENSKNGFNFNKFEKEFLTSLLCDNCIISLPHDMFISNKNYKLFDKFMKIHIDFDEDDDILLQMNKLLKSKSDVTIKDGCDLEKLVFKIDALRKEN